MLRHSIMQPYTSYTHYTSLPQYTSLYTLLFLLILLEGVTAGFSYRSPRLRHFLLRHPGEIVLHGKSGGSDLWPGQKGPVFLIWGTSPSQISVSKFKSLPFSQRKDWSSVKGILRAQLVWKTRDSQFELYACLKSLVLAASSPWLPTQGWQRFSSACPHGPSHGKAPDMSTLTPRAESATHAPRLPAVNGLGIWSYQSAFRKWSRNIKDRSSRDTSLAISSKWMQPTDHKSTA